MTPPLGKPLSLFEKREVSPYPPKPERKHMLKKETLGTAHILSIGQEDARILCDIIMKWAIGVHFDSQLVHPKALAVAERTIDILTNVAGAGGGIIEDDRRVNSIGQAMALAQTEYARNRRTRDAGLAHDSAELSRLADKLWLGAVYSGHVARANDWRNQG